MLNGKRELVELKQAKLELLEAEAERRRSLPHLYRFPFYKWSWEFFNSRNKLLFLTAGNQLSKSWTQYRKVIEWATNKDLWPELWPHRTPSVFWYLLPTSAVADLEIRKKVIPEILPCGKYKDHPTYGWKTVKNGRGQIAEIQFNSGVSVVFKSYETDVDALQTGTVDYLAFDEELPVDLWPELQARVRATKGYISGVFTPTKSQQFWYDVMEGTGEKEKLPTAHKITASLYDCLTYSDGRPSFWTNEDIERIIAESPSEDEVQRRVFGRFIINKEMLRYPAFNESENIGRGGEIPKDWLWFAGIDGGSGSIRDPATIVFVAVRPDYKLGRVAKMWLGTPENIAGEDKNTTAADVLHKYLEMKGETPIIAAYYDSQDIDMGIIAQREGIPIIKAQKNKDLGDGTLNSLFKNRMLEIDPVPLARNLVHELTHLRVDHVKRTHRQSDDLVDALRYCTVLIPWDFNGVIGKATPKEEKNIPTTDEIFKDRRLAWAKDEDEFDILKQIEEVNREYEGF